jgi:hypothetical protein
VDPLLVPSALLLLAASAAGALPLLTRRWSERGLHLFVAASAGIFLGTIFFHLGPHLAGAHAHGGAEAHVEAEVEPGWAWGAALAGFLLLFAAEKLWLPRRAHGTAADPHAVLWPATFLGLSLHALTAGVALAGVLGHPEARAQLLLGVLVHKASECFSLATVLRLGGLSGTRALALVAGFALIEPLALLLGGGLAALHPAVAPILTGFAVGTFLYVAVCDLVPEVFHGAGSARTKLACFVVGALATALDRPRLEAAWAFALRALQESWEIAQAMAPFLLLGFLLAGALHVWMRPEAVARRLGGDDLRSVGWAALVGAPLPLCSCSVVPVALSLRRAGASKGATAAFAVSTPETGVDSVAVTWALLDPLMTVARPVGALLSALASGSAVNWLVRRGLDREPAPAAALPAGAAAPHDCCARQPSAPPDSPGGEHARPADAQHVHAAPRGGRLVRALRFALVELPDDLAGSLLAGILLSGVISAAVPDGWFSGTLAAGAMGYVLALLVGLPLYVCAAASTPVAAAMILKGMSPGAAFVFLLIGPATNAASLVVLSRALGRRVVALHVAVIGASALALGWIVDRIYAAIGAPSVAMLEHDHELLPAWTGWVAAALLGALVAAALVRTYGSRGLIARMAQEPEPAGG